MPPANSKLPLKSLVPEVKTGYDHIYEFKEIRTLVSRYIDKYLRGVAFYPQYCFIWIV